MQVRRPQAGTAVAAASAADYAEPLCQSLSSSQVLDDLVGQPGSWRLSSQRPLGAKPGRQVAEVERERAALLQHWQLRLERAVYETERAARQYQACGAGEPFGGP